MKYTFGEFIKEYEICIPIIQRDYAQGREDKKYIREEFLGQIEEVLAYRKDALELDYVYGYKDEKERFCPLDGQQRFTTLWLVFWYLSLKSGSLDEYKKISKGFTYQTRSSSEEFCEKLWEANNFSESKIKEQDKKNLVDFIENQPWFLAAWKKDPTIRAMLTTIGGIDKKDGIESVFKVAFKKDGTLYKNKRGWNNYKDRLLDCISFYVLEIDKEKLKKEAADDLYIKMNARGKSLSDYENFKADLFARCREDEYSKRIDLPGTEAEKNRELDLYLSEKMDYEWNDPFWRNLIRRIDELKNSDNERDINAAEDFEEKIGLDTNQLLFSFVNRFCFGRLCVMKDKRDEKDEYLLNSSFVRYIDDIYDIDEEMESDGDDAGETLKDGNKTRKNAKKELKKHIKKSTSESETEKESTSESVKVVETLRTYDYLFNEDNLSYESFSHYENVLSPEGMDVLIKVLNGFSQELSGSEKWIDCISILLNEIVPESCSERRANGSAYIFLPQYIRKKIYEKKKYIGEGDFISHRDKGGNLIGTAGSMDLKGRAYFFGMCKYLEINPDKDDKDKELFKDWLYFCRNVIENAGLDSQSAMIECLRQIDEYGKMSHDIINGLKNCPVPTKSSKLESQIREEILKAQYICECSDPVERQTRKKRIREAENYAFFCGAIRFLFLASTTSGKSTDLASVWEKFDSRFTTIRNFVIPDKIETENKVSFDFVQAFAKQFEGLDDPDLLGLKLFHTIGWARRGDSWMDILCDPKLINQVGAVLDCTNTEPPYSGKYRSFIDSENFKKIVEKRAKEYTESPKKFTDLCITKRVDKGYVLAKKNGNFFVYQFKDMK